MPTRLARLIGGRIAVKLVLTLVGFVAVTTFAAGLYLTRALDRFAVESLETRLETAGRLLHDDARALLRRRAGPAELAAFARRAAQPTESRVTVLGLDGWALADSEVEPADLGRLENDAHRAELRAALTGRVGHDLRGPGNAPILYVAVPVRDGERVLGVLRFALPLAAVTSSYADLHRVMLAGGLVALLVAFGIGIFVAGRVTRPVIEMQAIARQMSEGRFSVRAPVRSLDELGALGLSLNVMAVRLRDQIETLQSERARATAILDGMVEGVMAVDAHESILLLNERARMMFGVGPGRGEGKPFLEVIRNADLHEVFRDSRRRGGVSRRELHLTAPVERMLRVTAVPLPLAGEAPGLVMVVDDVTELRRLEHVRTEFVANVSHELRTPLTAIQGYLETLLGGALDEPEHARRFLEIAFRHTERLGRLLNDLTDLSNIELGKVSLQLAPTPLGPVVESVLEIVAAKARDGGVAVSAVASPGLVVTADHDRLAQILINLVDNAVKYTPRGGTVSLQARSLGAHVEVAVVDTGVGIPRADLPRITERFYRVDKARSRELGGTGLGLAIVKHLVLAHGGDLAIESEEGRGTTVRVLLPAAGAHDPDQLPLPMPSASR